MMHSSWLRAPLDGPGGFGQLWDCFMEISVSAAILTAMREKTVRLLMPLVGAVLLSACGASPEERFAEAEASFASQDFNAARVAVAAALRERPDNLRMLALLCQSQLRLGDPDGAMVTIGRLRAAGANGPAVARFQAEARLLAGKPDEVLALLGQDRTPDAWRLRARAQIALNRAEDALTSFEQGARAGNDVRLFADYVWFHVSANDLAAAEPLLKRLQGFAPQAMETLIVAGDLAVRQGRVDAALADYRRAAKLYPTRFQPHVSEAELFERIGKLDDAVKAADAANAVEPGHPVIVALRLRLAGKQGRWRDLRAWLQGQEDVLDPQSLQGQLYAEALLRLGQPEQARLFLGRALLMQPGNRHVRLLLGEALLAGGSADDAYETLVPLAASVLAKPEELALAEKAARAAGRPEADALRARLQSPAYRDLVKAADTGDAALRRGDWAGAASAYRSMLAAGEDATVLANLAYASCKAGRCGDAVALADRAVALAPDDPAILKAAALARLDSGSDRAAAVRLLRQAQQADPADGEIALLLRRARTGPG